MYWVHCARNGGERAFARDAQQCLWQLPNAHRMVVYSQPLVTDALGVGYDRQGRFAAHQLLELGIPENADVYLCGPATFMADMRDALAAVPIPPAHIRSELYGTQASMMPGVVPQPSVHSPHVPAGAAGTGPLVSFARSGVTVRWDDRYGSLIELAEAWMSRCVGRAVRASATPASAGCWRGPWITAPNRSTGPMRAAR